MPVKKLLWVSLTLIVLISAGCASAGGVLSTSTASVTPLTVPTDTQVPSATSQPSPAETQAPPPTATGIVPPDWQVYQGAGFTFAYPPDAQLVDTDRPDAFPRVDFMVVPDTNLIEKYLQVSVSPPVDGLCSSPQTQGAEPGTYPSEKVVINGISFIKESGTQAATGNIYEFTSYTTQQGERCVSMTFVLHSANPGNYATPPVLFDPVAESKVFDQVAGTFQFTDNGN